MPVFQDFKRLDEQYPNVDKIDHGDLIELQKAIRATVIDGTMVTQARDGEFIGHVIMLESVFVQNWMRLFAIGKMETGNYFDYNGWSAVTEKHTKGVIVVADEDYMPLFVIQSFAKPRFGLDQANILNRLANQAAGANNVHDEHQKNQIIHALATDVDHIVNNESEDFTITDLIPDWAYAKNGIVPMALRAMIYIRDRYKNDLDDETHAVVENAFNKLYSGQYVAQGEKDIILKLTNNEFNFDLIQNDVDPDTIEQTTSAVKPVKKATYDPYND